MYFFNFNKESTPALQQNIGKKVLYEGWLYKWTNFIGSWRQRYFTLYAGSLSYAIEKNSPVKETFSLSHCKIRICPDDPTRLEIDTLERGVIFLRTDNITEKQKWYVAIKRAQQQYLKVCRRDVKTPAGIYSVSLPEKTESEKIELQQKLEVLESKLLEYSHSIDNKTTSFEHSTKPPIDINELFVKSNADFESKSPLNCLIDNLISFKEISQTIFTEIHSIESQTLSHINSIPQSVCSTSTKSLECTFVELIQRVDSIEKLVLNYNSSMENLLAEENIHSKQLEKSLKWLAKQNYQLEKAQLKASASRDNGSAEMSVKRSPGPLGANTLSHEMKAITNERLLMSNAQETDDEFYECEDNSCSSKRSTSISSSVADIMPLESAGTPDKQNDRPLEDNESPRPKTSIKQSTSKFEWRSKLPVPRTSLKVSLWSILKECIGKDISRIRLPVFLNEPTSFLQRSSEDFEYYHLLEKASTFTDSTERTAWVTLFSITPYESTIGRTYKPFNPLLGETFELTHLGYNFFTEQVEHHPPLAAFDCKHERFHCYGHTHVKSKVTGKSVEVKVYGPYYINLKTPNSDEYEHYRVQRVNLVVHNIIFGTIWIEFIGTSILTNFSTGDFAIVQFLKKGWFDKELHKIRAVIFDCKGNGRFYIRGVWSDHLILEKIKKGSSVFFTPWKHFSGGKMINKDNTFNYDKNAFKTEGDAWDSFISNIDWDNIQVEIGSTIEPWRPNKRPANNAIYYGFSYMTMQLNQLSPEYDPEHGAIIATTDSRFRPDRIAYENGELEYAGQEKNRLEEKQREAARNRKEPYEPLYFKKIPHPLTSEPVYTFNNLYWERKKDGSVNDYSPDIF